jgi:regulation of enolase protein 1 (concanavalin A-like superfamily)
MPHLSRSVLCGIGAAAMIAGAVAAATPAQADPPPVATIVLAPNGNDSNSGDLQHPILTLAQAQTLARAFSAHRDVVVELAGGVYRLSAPLRFTSADSGRNGHSVTWQALPGQAPVISGGRAVRGWTLHDSDANIWVAKVPKGSDSRQLYVDGSPAPRAAISISRRDVQITASGLTITNPALGYLASLPQQNRIELESLDSFTDRYAPVDHITGNTITMQQPAWNNNNWGYDTLAHPFGGGQLLLENSYSFLQTAGQWYLDPQAGLLYYKAAPGQSPDAHDIELPRLTSLLQISGTYSDPVHDLSFKGLRFEHTTWLTPGTSIGYADQQNGAFIPTAVPQPADFLTSCQSGCQLFEGARNGWAQMPAAVQVSAASTITFADNTFTDLGQVALGIGNDADAHASGIGLGASNITVFHNTFTNDSGAGVVAGGIRPDAHHPSNPAVINKDIAIKDNLVTAVAKDYKEMSGILSTYATHTVIAHNEVSDLAYDGIDVGWGWGANDAGGSQDYQNRGLYNYQPIYTTPTTLRDTEVTDNLIHGIKKVFHDGGALYNLSANPGSVFSGNYIYDTLHTVGLYLDEGSRYVTEEHNVIQDCGVWVFTNSYGTINNTSDNVLAHNWYNSGITQTPNATEHNNQLIDNVQVSDGSWPLAAQQVMYNAGIEPALRTDADSQPAPAGLSLTSAATSLDPGSSTTITAAVQDFSTDGLSNLTLSLNVPAGWTATQTSAPATTVPAGGTTTATWQLTAPATVTVPINKATITLTASYDSGGKSYSASPTTTVTTAGALTTLKSFGSVPAVFGQAGDDYAILVGGNDIWGANGEHFDEYGTIYSPQAAGPTSTVTVKVTAQQPIDPWSKAGLVIRSDVTAAGAAQGYVVLVATPGNGVSMQWSDAATPGYLDHGVSSPNTIKAPVWLRLTRNGDQVSGYYSTDGTTWTQVGSAVTLTGATANEDAGMISTAHSGTQGEADFSGFTIS